MDMTEEGQEVSQRTTNKWDKRIQRAQKFTEQALQHGRRVYNRYQDKREGVETRLKRVNIFYANVNTIKESLFNSMPKPDVRKLHAGNYEDNVARVAALVMQRCLHYELQCSEHFEQAVKAAILDRLVPGIGQVWPRFGMRTSPSGEETEAIYLDTVFWEDFIWEPARSWSQVTWCGRRLELTKNEVVKRWGEAGLAQLQHPRNDNNVTPKEILDNKFEVFEIWDKKTRKVFHIAKGSEFVLDESDDPYNLDGFFPCPCPLIANVTTSAFLPVTDYHIAQDQYNQLDVLYARISLIIEAIKVAGVYDAAESATIGRMLEGQENKLVPVDNWAMYAEKGGAKGMIDWYPVEQCAAVLQNLQTQFEAIKALLGEISGMADIVRGDTNQYETAKAQQIKAQFASVRMNGYQRDVAQFVRDILRIMAGLICNLYSDQKVMAIAGTFSEGDQQYLPQAAAVLRNDFQRMYKVDIETDSLTQADWALEKEQRMEVVGYIGQLLSQAVPAVESTPELGPLMLGLIKFSVSGFKGAAEIEGILSQQLDAMTKKALADQQNPDKEKEPTPEERAVQAQMQLEQAKLQGQQQLAMSKAQFDQQLATQQAEQQAILRQQESNAKLEIERIQAQADMATQAQKNELELERQRMMIENDRIRNQMEMDFAERTFQMEMAQKEREAEINERTALIQAQIKAESVRQQGEQKMQQAAAKHEAMEKEDGDSED